MTILEMLLNAVGYGRVSTGGQDEALSVDTQAAKMDDKAKEEGFQIIRLFRETSSGTSVRKRLAFLAMIEFVMNPANNIKAVFFYDPSRYTRDITDFYIYLRQLTRAGIQVHSVTLGQYKPANTATRCPKSPGASMLCSTASCPANLLERPATPSSKRP